MKGSEDEMIYSRRLKRAHRQITRALKSKMLLIIDQSNRLTMNAKKPKKHYPLSLLALYRNGHNFSLILLFLLLFSFTAVMWAQEHC